MADLKGRDIKGDVTGFTRATEIILIDLEQGRF